MRRTERSPRVDLILNVDIFFKRSFDSPPFTIPAHGVSCLGLLNNPEHWALNGTPRPLLVRGAAVDEALHRSRRVRSHQDARPKVAHVQRSQER